MVQINASITVAIGSYVEQTNVTKNVADSILKKAARELLELHGLPTDTKTEVRFEFLLQTHNNFGEPLPSSANGIQKITEGG